MTRQQCTLCCTYFACKILTTAVSLLTQLGVAASLAAATLESKAACIGCARSEVATHVMQHKGGFNL
jgi:hypothetical protein